MENSVRFTGAIAVLGLLAACSGSGSGSDAGSTPGTGSGTGDGPSFSALSAEAMSLMEQSEDSTATPVADMPTSGSASYSGVAGFAEGRNAGTDDVVIMSELSMEADFASGEVTGEMGNFRDDENNALSGSMEIQNGEISGNELSGNVDGEVTYGGTVGTVDLDMRGEFSGEEGSLLGGSMSGPAYNQSGEDTYITGFFGAERD